MGWTQSKALSRVCRAWNTGVVIGNLLYRARLAWFSLKEALFLRRHATRAARFAAIYGRRLWGAGEESASGEGSSLVATAAARSGLAGLIAAHRVGSILDAPCGDCHWIAQVSFAGDYRGVDIVPELIAANRTRHTGPGRSFAVADIVNDPVPPADLVLCRECLNHLPLADGRAALANLAAAAGKLLVVTHHPAIIENGDQAASFRFRRLNLTLPPFGLRAPDALIDEGEWAEGKTLAVWDMARGGPFAGVIAGIHSRM